MRKVKSFTCGAFNIDCHINELIQCTNPLGEVVDYDQIIRAKELGFDTSSFLFTPSYQCLLQFGYHGSIIMTIDQIIAFKELIEQISIDGAVTEKVYESLKGIPNIKFTPVIRLINPIDVALPDGTVITLLTNFDDRAFLSLLPAEYIVTEYKVLKFYQAKFTADTTNITMLSKFGDVTNLIEFFKRIITYYEDNLKPEDNGGLGIDALESEPTQTP